MDQDGGAEWIVDAFGCDPRALASIEEIRAFFDDVVHDLSLKPLASPAFHVFPGPGGITGYLMLAESHLSCHTFPETGFAAFDLFCCRERPEWPWEAALAARFGATEVSVRRLSRGRAKSVAVMVR